MHQVFHYKNDNQHKILQLYHGSSVKELDQLSQEQVFLKTVFSFSKNFAVAAEFATGSVWVVDNVYEGIYSGRIKGADVSWISKWDEAEYIILPTTFYQFREMTKQEIQENQWSVKSYINIYITEKCISNNDGLCIHGDQSLSELTPNYESFIESNSNQDRMRNQHKKQEEVMDWFKSIGFVKFEDEMNYYNLFIENGYETLDDIAYMTETDLRKEIGIRKGGHIKKLMRAINRIPRSASPCKPMLHLNNLVPSNHSTKSRKSSRTVTPSSSNKLQEASSFDTGKYSHICSGDSLVDVDEYDDNENDDEPLI